MVWFGVDFKKVYFDNRKWGTVNVCQSRNVSNALTFSLKKYPIEKSGKIKQRKRVIRSHLCLSLR